jgi:LemA protein
MQRFSILALVVVSLGGCGYNDLQQQDEYTKYSWAQVLSQYQRRADLVPALVSTVRAYAVHEQTVFKEITEARAELDTMRVSINDADALERYSRAQQRMGGALYRLLLAVENYPQLKSDNAFLDLQTQLEGTENRIAFARQRYIGAVAAYNVTVRSFPSNLTAKYFGYATRPTFTVEDEQAVSRAPSVNVE